MCRSPGWGPVSGVRCLGTRVRVRVRVRASTARTLAVESPGSGGEPGGGEGAGGSGGGGRDTGGGADPRRERAPRYCDWTLATLKCSDALKSSSTSACPSSSQSTGKSPSKERNPLSREYANRVFGVNPAACTRGGGGGSKGMMLFHNVRERRAAGSGAHPHRWVVDGRQRDAAAHRRQGRKSNDGHRPAQGAAGRALMLCWHAAQQQAPSPRARARVA